MSCALKARAGLLALCAATALGCSSDEGEAFGDARARGGAAGTTTGGAGSAGAGTTSAAGAFGGGGATAESGAGSSGAAAAGSAGVAGTSGAAGAGGSGGADPASPIPSPGCGMPASQELDDWVERPTLSVNDAERQWWVWLPAGYEPSRAYPLVFTFHGCGGPDNIVPMHEATGSDAILVRGTGVTDGCWTYGADGDDVAFFDAMLAEVKAKHCVDTSRVFVTGYSSGAWLVNTLACARGDELRGAGTVSGGVVGNRGTCKGKFARIFVHDEDDTTNFFVDHGTLDESTRVIEQNHCSADAAPVPEAPAPCARYQGCDAGYPVVMCLTQGEQHDRQDSLAPGAFWRLFSSL